MGTVDDLADALAKDVLEAADEMNNPMLVDDVAGVILAQSQTLQEAFMTAIRVRRSERAGRAYLAKRIKMAAEGKTAPLPPTADNPDIH